MTVPFLQEYRCNNNNNNNNNKQILQIGIKPFSRLCGFKIHSYQLQLHGLTVNIIKFVITLVNNCI